MKAYRVSRCWAACILNHGTRWEWMVRSCTVCSLHTHTHTCICTVYGI